MQLRSGIRRALFALLPLAAAACTDKSPTVTGDQFFPGGGRPVTLQTILTDPTIFTNRGTFSGYPPGADFPAAVLVANKYGGQLDAHGLLRLTGFPTRISYTQGTSVRNDSLFTYGAGTLVAHIDSAGSRVAATTLRIRDVAQAWDRGTATWTVAIDTTGVHSEWTVPGGTPGGLIAATTWNPGDAGDSLVIDLDSLTVARLADTTYKGMVLTTDEAGSRIQLSSFVLRTRVHPKGASPDTAIAQTITGNEGTYIFTPDPPSPPAGQWAVGGVRSSRSLFDMDLDRTVPGCAAGGAACAPLSLRDVSLNEVAVLLRPVAPPPAFATLDSIPITVRRVLDPELGFRAPLSSLVSTSVAYHPGDTLVAVPITDFVKTAVARDTLTGTFAVLSEPAANTFGLVWFEPTPRLRVTYTLPVQARLP